MRLQMFPGQLSVVSRVVLLLASLVLGLLPSATFAAEVRQAETVTIPRDETINDDLYILGRTLTVDGTVRGDVFAMGADILVRGTVVGDVVAAGGTVVVAGRVDGSVRAAGGTVSIAGEVTQDVMAAGGALFISKESVVGRDIWFSAGTGQLDGQVRRNVLMAAGDVNVAGQIGGDLTGTTTKLTLGTGASVRGNLIYTSEANADIAGGATVQGTTMHTVPDKPAEAEESPIAAGVRGWFQALVGLFLLGILFAMLFPAAERASVAILRDAPWPSLGAGIALFLVTPLAAMLIVLLGAFFGGWWLGLFAMALFVIGLTVGQVVVATLIGELIAYYAKRPVHWLLVLLTGLALLLLAGALPLLGGLATLSAMVFGIGALAIAVVRLRTSPGMTLAAG